MALGSSRALSYARMALSAPRLESYRHLCSMVAAASIMRCGAGSLVPGRSDVTHLVVPASLLLYTA